MEIKTTNIQLLFFMQSIWNYRRSLMQSTKSSNKVWPVRYINSDFKTFLQTCPVFGQWGSSGVQLHLLFKVLRSFIKIWAANVTKWSTIKIGRVSDDDQNKGHFRSKMSIIRIQPLFGCQIQPVLLNSFCQTSILNTLSALINS